MANKKISELTEVQSVNNADVVPIVQSGTTKKTPISKILSLITNATTTVAGLMSATDKVKLNGLSNYTHPNTSGNKHIPSGGAIDKILKWSEDGTAIWSDEKDTTYSVATTTSNGLMSKENVSKLAGLNNTTVVDNLTSTSATSALSSKQGKILNDKHIFSADEKIVGTWFGKPLYRKTIAISGLHSASIYQTNIEIPHGIANVEKIYIDQGNSFFTTGDEKNYIFGRAFVSNGAIVFNGACNVNTSNINIEVYINSEITITGYVTVNYTKTTD